MGGVGQVRSGKRVIKEEEMIPSGSSYKSGMKGKTGLWKDGWNRCRTGGDVASKEGILTDVILQLQSAPVSVCGGTLWGELIVCRPHVHARCLAAKLVGVGAMTDA